jgi:metal-responsive CopG/Arc/MetJ family transcriptional regulator
MEVICTRFTQNETEQIDARRAARSRSAFIRDAVREKVERES